MEKKNEGHETQGSSPSDKNLLKYFVVFGPFIFIAILCFIEMR